MTHDKKIQLAWQLKWTHGKPPCKYPCESTASYEGLVLIFMEGPDDGIVYIDSVAADGSRTPWVESYPYELNYGVGANS